MTLCHEQEPTRSRWNGSLVNRVSVSLEPQQVSLEEESNVSRTSHQCRQPCSYSPALWSEPSEPSESSPLASASVIVGMRS